MVKKFVDWVFALPPDVVQEYEVAGVTAGLVVLNLNVSADEKGALVAAVAAVYMAAKAIDKAVEGARSKS